MKDETNLAAMMKRGTPSCWPHEINIIDDPSDPGFDERLENPIKEERVRSLLLVGQAQALALRLRDDGKVVIVEGRQRWKIATLINHLAGVKLYKGKVEAIHEAIETFKGTELEELCADRASKGLRLTFTAFRGDETRATRATAAANEQRDDDPLNVKIKRVQRMVNVLNHDVGDVAVDMGVTTQTINRWLKVDADKKRQRRKPNGKRRPGAKRLSMARDALKLNVPANLLLGWVLGDVGQAELVAAWPALGEVVA